MSVTGHEVHQAVFIVRLARDPTGRVTGVVERVRTGEKERVAAVEEIGQVLAAIEHLRQDMGMARRLKLSAHHAERHHGAPVAAEHARNDGVQRALAGRDGVGVASLHAKARAAVLQEHAGFGCINAAAEGREEGVDEVQEIQ